MKMLLLKAARINHSAGEIVEVSPAQAEFLLSVDAAEYVPAEQRKTPEASKTRVTRKK